MHKSQLKRSWWISKWYQANSERFDLMFETCSASGLIRPLWPNLLATGSRRGPPSSSEALVPLSTAFSKKVTGDASGLLWEPGGGGPHSLLAEFGHIGHMGCFCQGSAYNVSFDINKNKFLASGSGKS